jgi:3-mercaptopyruvate sulfurtransferase SseA
MNFHVIRCFSYTEPDLMRRLVPVWHSAGLAQRLLNRGYPKVYALKGGWKEWFKAGYPVEKKSPLLL